MDNDAWNRLYRLLHAMGLPQPTLNFPHPTRPDGMRTPPGAKRELKTEKPLPIAWPDHKVGVCFDFNDPKMWEREDWTVVRLSSQLSHSLPDPLRFLDDLLFSHTLRASETSAQQSVSKTERAVLDALLRHGLPAPDRNHQIHHHDDGRLLTIPDFVWNCHGGPLPQPGTDATTCLAVFVDGTLWHAGAELREMLSNNAGAGRRKVVKERVKTKASKDADARAYMTSLGWTVIAVGDGTVDEGGQALAAAVDNIVVTYQRLRDAAAA